MATVINNPGSTTDNSGGIGFLVGVVLLILFVVGLLYYGVPFMRRGFSVAQPSISVPEQVDVNVNTP